MIRSPTYAIAQGPVPSGLGRLPFVYLNIPYGKGGDPTPLLRGVARLTRHRFKILYLLYTNKIIVPTRSPVNCFLFLSIKLVYLYWSNVFGVVLHELQKFAPKSLLSGFVRHSDKIKRLTLEIGNNLCKITITTWCFLKTFTAISLLRELKEDF